MNENLENNEVNTEPVVQNNIDEVSTSQEEPIYYEIPKPPKKKKNVTKIIIIVLVIIIVALAGYLIYDKILKKEEPKPQPEIPVVNDDDNKEEENNTLKEVSVNDVRINELMTKFQVDLNSAKNTGDLFELFFSGNKVGQSLITDEIASTLAINYMIESKQLILTDQTEDSEGTVVDIAVVNNVIKNLFGSNTTLKFIDPSLIKDEIIDGVTYSYSLGGASLEYKNNQVVAWGIPWGATLGDSVDSKTLIKAEEDDNNFYVYQKMVIFTMMPSEYAFYKNYNDFVADKYIITSSIYETFDSFYRDNLDKLDTYKWTFKKDDNNYYFESIELSN